MDTLVAEKLLTEAKMVVPNTDSGKVTFIADWDLVENSRYSRVETKELKECVKAEQEAIGKLVNILSIQSRYDSTPEIMEEYCKIIKIVFDDSLSKGYIDCCEGILRQVALGVVDRNLQFDKNEFVKEGVLGILACCGKVEIISKGHRMKTKAINIIVKQKQKYFGEIDLTDDVMFCAYNDVKIGSYKIKNRITEENIREYQGY